MAQKMVAKNIVSRPKSLWRNQNIKKLKVYLSLRNADMANVGRGSRE
jgi:hypothetical protein